MYLFVYIYMGVLHCMDVEVKGQIVAVCFLLLRVLRIELRLFALVASTFSC